MESGTPCVRDIFGGVVPPNSCVENVASGSERLDVANEHPSTLRRFSLVSYDVAEQHTPAVRQHGSAIERLAVVRRWHPTHGATHCVEAEAVWRSLSYCLD
jgi:hypothetical protein